MTFLEMAHTVEGSEREFWPAELQSKAADILLSLLKEINGPDLPWDELAYAFQQRDPELDDPLIFKSKDRAIRNMNEWLTPSGDTVTRYRLAYTLKIANRVCVKCGIIQHGNENIDSLGQNIDMCA